LKNIHHFTVKIKYLFLAAGHLISCLPYYDICSRLFILDSKLNEIVRKIEAYEKRLFTHPLHGKPETENLIVQVEKKQKVLNDIKEKKKELKKAKQVIQLDELKARKRVLRRLGYATTADVIETKGRVACEISTADEVRSQLNCQVIKSVVQKISVFLEKKTSK
jgi:superfamily II RNA helicase